ncbi:DUF3105 domain-containing protein [Streptomyces sp. NPDC060194]|uniref:DUF3105 domain-containing protein n=1 Tax=Streptomyces sp. NPDC060194 TaxID=3347069 RepID=UPI00365B3444
MGSAKKNASDRRARIEEMRRAEQARDRRNRILTITVSAVIVLAIGGGAYWAVSAANEKDEQQAAEARKPVEGEKSWDPKKLGRNHVTEPVKYDMTPPVGGDHDQVWANCEGDVYKQAIADKNAVHSLEHGAVWVTYNKSAAEADVKALEEKVGKTPYSLMSPYDGQKGTIMLSAWGKQLTVDKASDPRVDQFFTKYVQGPQTPEKGAACTGGIGQ